MENIRTEHYYGDSIRVLFIITGVLMVATLPFFSSLINIPIVFSLLGILVLATVGGFLNPAQKWIIIVNAIVSVAAFMTFEYYAIDTYLSLPSDQMKHVLFFWVNQIFALFFFLATYLSIKTLRGKLLSGNRN